jgi:hypothetical protein
MACVQGLLGKIEVKIESTKNIICAGYYVGAEYKKFIFSGGRK